MFQTKAIENIKTQFAFSIFFKENRAVYHLMWKNNAEPRQTTGNNIELHRKDVICIPDN
jgi:hypothetical protein